MRRISNPPLLDRRRLLIGAGATATTAFFGRRGARAQTAGPAPTPMPIRLQTPDLAFADALRTQLSDWAAAHGAADLVLSIVPAEPASDSLLNDARSGARRFSGALIPNWTIPDLVREDFIIPAPPPSQPLPQSVAQSRSFGGIWVATDLDHDCDLLYYRRDLLEKPELVSGFGGNLVPAETWDELQDQATYFFDRIGGGIALPLVHAQQVADHFAAMAASFVLALQPTTAFWLDPSSLAPSIDSEAHSAALDRWRQLGRTSPSTLQNGSTGELWQAFLDGSVAYLMASGAFLPYALDSGIDPGVLGVSQLPGIAGPDGNVVRVGNPTGAGWGGVVMQSANTPVASKVQGFLAHLADPAVQSALWSDRSTGLIPAPANEADAQSIAAYLQTKGWPADLSTQWTSALFETMTAAIQLPPLRIAETRRYVQALQDRIVPFLASADDSPTETLTAVAADWSAINDAIGIDTQLDLHTRSSMLPPGS